MWHTGKGIEFCEISEFVAGENQRIDIGEVVPEAGCNHGDFVVVEGDGFQPLQKGEVVDLENVIV